MLRILSLTALAYGVVDSLISLHSNGSFQGTTDGGNRYGRSDYDLKTICCPINRAITTLLLSSNKLIHSHSRENLLFKKKYSFAGFKNIFVSLDSFISKFRTRQGIVRSLY